MHPALEHAVWSSPNDGAKWRETAIAQMTDQLGSFSSQDRLDVALILLRHSPTDVFWPVFLDAWPSCDATHHLRPKLLGELRKHAGRTPSRRFATSAEQAFWDALPDQVRVFRGSSAARVRSPSWTTDRAVAEGFARGHRSIRVPDPVIASAVVPKVSIFAVFSDREEREVLLDPRRLRQLTVAPLRP